MQLIVKWYQIGITAKSATLQRNEDVCKLTVKCLECNQDTRCATLHIFTHLQGKWCKKRPDFSWNKIIIK